VESEGEKNTRGMNCVSYFLFF